MKVMKIVIGKHDGKNALANVFILHSTRFVSELNKSRGNLSQSYRVKPREPSV